MKKPIGMSYDYLKITCASQGEYAMKANGGGHLSIVKMRDGILGRF